MSAKFALYRHHVIFFSLAFFFAESLLPFQPLLLCLMHSAAGDPTTSAPVLHLNSICWQEVEEVVGGSYFSLETSSPKFSATTNFFFSLSSLQTLKKGIFHDINIKNDTRKIYKNI